MAEQISSVSLHIPGVPTQHVGVGADWLVSANGVPQLAFAPENALFMAALADNADKVIACHELPAIIHQTYRKAKEAGAPQLKTMESLSRHDKAKNRIPSRFVRTLVGQALSDKRAPIAHGVFALRTATPYAVLLTTDNRRPDYGLAAIESHSGDRVHEFLAHFSQAYRRRFPTTNR